MELGGDAEWGRKQEIKLIKMCYVYVPVPHNESIYYVSQTYTNEKTKKNKKTINNPQRKRNQLCQDGLGIFVLLL